MKLLYLSLSYVPSRRASSVQVMRMCEAFARAGHDVTLVAKRGPDGEDPFAFYGVDRCFRLELLPRPRRRGGGVIYALAVMHHVLASRADLVYSRDLSSAGALAAQLGLPTAYRSTRHLRSRLAARAAAPDDVRVELPGPHPDLAGDGARARPGRSATAGWSCGDRRAQPGERITGLRAARDPRHTAADRIAASAACTAGAASSSSCRWAERLPAYRFEIVGGSDADLARWRRERVPDNVVFRGFQPPALLAAIYRDFDVLLMPYPHAGIHGATQRLDTAKYCSPMKMFEYMAAGVPIVSSDLPVLGEVIHHERNALIAPAGDVDAWSAAIDRLVHDATLRVRLARHALADLRAFTPEARVEKILAGLGASPGAHPHSRTAPGRSTGA